MPPSGSQRDSGSGPASPGRTFLPDSAVGRRSTTVIAGGRRTARGRESCGPSRPTPMPRAGSTGAWSASIPRPSALVSTGPAPPPAEIPARRRSPERHRPDEALGRSRGGLTSKIHLAGGGGCRPLGFVITPGQWGDAPQMIAVLEEIRVPRQAGGRPRTRPDHVGGDKAYSSRRNRRHLRRRQIKHTIPEPRDQRANSRHQPTQDLPSHRHALRQTGARLPRNGHRSGDPLMAASGMSTPFRDPRYPGSGGEVR